VLFIVSACACLLFVICMFVDVHVVYVCGSVITERERGEETRHSGRAENGMAFDGQHDSWMIP
jgi:hypothetical protein